jgi:hypothetical protein
MADKTSGVDSMRVSSLRACLPLSAACNPGPSLLRGGALFLWVVNPTISLPRNIEARIAGQGFLTVGCPGRLAGGLAGTEGGSAVASRPPSWLSARLWYVFLRSFFARPAFPSSESEGRSFRAVYPKPYQEAGLVRRFLGVNGFLRSALLFSIKLHIITGLLNGPNRKGVVFGFLQCASI